jgi:hypothetical protein
VAVAFNAGNLGPVAQALRARFPTSRLVLCADDDVAVDGNPGLTNAKQAARAVNRLVVPDFGENRPSGMTDFNDLHQLQAWKRWRSAFVARYLPNVVFLVFLVCQPVLVRALAGTPEKSLVFQVFQSPPKTPPPRPRTAPRVAETSPRYPIARASGCSTSG